MRLLLGLALTTLTISSLGAQPHDVAGPAKDKGAAADLPVDELSLLPLLFPRGPNYLAAAALRGVLRPVPGETPPVDPLAEKVRRLSGVLRHDNALVRKRALLALARLDPPPKDAIPAILEMAVQDTDSRNKVLAQDALDKFTTPEKIEALVKTLRNTKEDPARRVFVSKFLPVLYKHPKAEDSHREDIRDALEGALADDEREVQLMAARALEVVDTTTTAAPRTVRLDLDPALLRLNGLTAAEALKRIQKGQPGWNARLVLPDVIEVTLSAADQVVPEDFVLLQRGPTAVRVRDLIAR